jgi:hypothetical protein
MDRGKSFASVSKKKKEEEAETVLFSAEGKIRDVAFSS